MEAQGKVEAISYKRKGWGIKIDGKWYGAIGLNAPNKGDVVHVEYEDKEVNDRIFHNVSKMDILEVSLDAPKSTGNDYSIRMQRQQCLKAAAVLVAPLERHLEKNRIKTLQEEVIKVANRFNEYVEEGK